MSTETLALRDRIDLIAKSLSKELFEKEQIVRLVLLSALSGQSVFLLGPPGVAKSMIARRLKYAFKDAKVFEYLMGKFSTPDEVFGPVSISKLKDEDKYERLTEHYLPGANIVFLDEIWKASPPIQNALLTVLNEKVYRNGAQEIQVALRALIAASNELPQQGEGLEALWDRFLLRLLVENIEAAPAFEEMLLLPSDLEYIDVVPDELKITDEEYLTWRRHIGQIKLPPHILGLLTYLREQINLRNVEIEPENVLYISDRRWRKISMLLRTSAFLNGRDEVLIIDAFLIEDCLWDRLEQRIESQELVRLAIEQHGYRRMVPLDPIRSELQALRLEIEQETHEMRTETVEQVKIMTDSNQQVYYSFADFFGDGDGFIRENDWKRLTEERAIHVPVLEKTGANFRAFHTFSLKRVGEHQVENKGKIWSLTTETTERKRTQRKQPPAELARIWDSQIQLLIDNCEQGIQALEARRHHTEPYLTNHLFVPFQRAQTARQALTAMTEELLTLRLEIQKTRHLYAHWKRIDQELASFMLFGGIMTGELRQFIAELLFRHLYEEGTDAPDKLAHSPIPKLYPRWHQLLQRLLTEPNLPKLTRNNEDFALSVARECLDWCKRTFQAFEGQFERRQDEERLAKLSDQKETIETQEWLSTLQYLQQVYPQKRMDWDFYALTLQQAQPSGDPVASARLSRDQAVLKRKLLQDWKQLLSQEKAEAEQSYLETEFSQYVDELSQKIEQLQELGDLLAPFYNFLGKLGINP